ncbi:class A beta-lactamase [Parafrigoribacterium soli]|uniref:class A beta-lactamase n=1 Tax=Parafrigoribacterium soli TaxID=3144663 RepID=UPI0032EB0EBE
MMEHRSSRLARAALVALAVMALVGCASTLTVRAHPFATPSPTRQAPSANPQFRALEAQFDVRLGVYALDTGSGLALGYRGDERFAYASTIKVLAAAMLLNQTTEQQLDTLVRFDKADLLAHSPITTQRLGSGMTLRELTDAALRYSDNTAANLIFEHIGGPSGLGAWLKRAGDGITHVDRKEPELNEASPGDIRDTSTPEALARDLESLLIGRALAADDRAALTAWMMANTTGGGLIRAGVQSGWKVADKSGSGGYGTRNDIAVIWPATGAPIVLVVMSSSADRNAQYDDALIVQATATAIGALRP